MADNHFSDALESLFRGLDGFISTKTVVGEPLRIDGAIILPLVDVTCGIAAGAFTSSDKNNGGGGMSAKMTPSAILVIQNGATRLVTVKQQDPLTRIIDMVPDIMNRITGKTGEVSPEAVKAAEDMASKAEPRELKE